jgi:hypothetical protein
MMTYMLMYVRNGHRGGHLIVMVDLIDFAAAGIGKIKFKEVVRRQQKVGCQNMRELFFVWIQVVRFVARAFGQMLPPRAEVDSPA